MKTRCLTNRSPLARLGLTLLLTLAALGVMLVAITWAQPGNPIPAPDPNTHTAPLTTTVSITYDEPMDPTTVTSRTFAVHGMFSGLVTATHAVANGGYTLIVTPSHPFFPGELVYTIATTQTTNLTGTHPLSSTLWQFNAEAPEGWGRFDETPLNVGTGSDETRSVAWADWDGDGDLDLAVGNGGAQNAVYLNNGDGSFGAAVNFGSGSDATLSLAWGDFDADGDLDLAVGNDGGQNAVYRNTGGAFGTAVNVGPDNDDTRSLAWGDFDGDGDLDLAVGNYYEQNAVYLNDGDGSFGAAVNFGTGGDATRSLAWGDFDGDGDLDLAAGNDGQNAVYPNNGGSFGAAVNFGTGSDWTTSLAWADFDADGDLDLAAGNYGQNAIYFNEPTTRYLYLPLIARNHVVAPDLVVQSIAASSNTIQVTIRNDGNAPVTGEFWVDVYIDPSPAPTAVNQIWPQLASQGLVWGVTKAALPLNPGDTLTLTIGDAYYVAAYSSFSGNLATGTPVYAQVDSWNAETTYGVIREYHEILNGDYNNIGSTTVTLDALDAPPAVDPAATPGGFLPPR